MVIHHPVLMLDACCLINLHASGRLAEIAQVLPTPVVVSEIVWEQEVPTLRQVDEVTGKPAEKAVADDIIRIISFDIIRIISFDAAEAEAFVDFAAELGDDGEAATCSIAFRRGWAIATDDRAAVRFIRRESPQLQIVSSLDLIKHWADDEEQPVEAVREALIKVRDIGRYVPGRSHPLWNWWEAMMQQQ